MAIQSDTVTWMWTRGSKIYSGAISTSLLGPGGREGVIADILVEDTYQGLLSTQWFLIRYKHQNHLFLNAQA